MKLAIVIINWNGVELLKKFLPKLIKHSKNNSIYIIDNNSSDESVDYVKEYFPIVKLIVNSKNYSYAKGYNIGLKQIKEELYCLINNDIEVTKGWIDPILDQFKANKFLTVAQPKILDYNNKDKFEHAGACGGYIDYFGYPFCRGRIFNSIEKDNGQYDYDSDIFWASGACFFIKSKVFHELGGFDENFHNHMEEIDLCWRISNKNNKLQKKLIHNSTVYHIGGASLNYDNPEKIFYNIRNHKWMMIKNSSEYHTNPIIKIYIFVITIFYAFYLLLSFRFDFFKAVFKAVFSKRNETIKYSSSKNKIKYHYRKSIITDYLMFCRRKFSQLK